MDTKDCAHQVRNAAVTMRQDVLNAGENSTMQKLHSESGQQAWDIRNKKCMASLDTLHQLQP